LFFAYARKVKYINGKKRIEWFTFEEKALNAAVTAMINELMEKVHELGKKNETEISSLSFDLKGFCQSVLKDILEIEFLRKRLIILGPKSSGKSVLKSMLNGEKLKCMKKFNSDNSCFISQQVGLDI
jgi:polynucleotide 5'-kinase involved in rRNA processing